MKTLFRPVGLIEMKLILDLELNGFPPRLPEQPIFYPVLNQAYADQIALEWNTKDKVFGSVGFVTEFNVASPFIDKYEEQIVGSRNHNELWIPAEDLEELNNNIEGQIKIVNVFYGSNYKGLTPELTIFEDKNPKEQFIIWKEILDYNSMDFYCEIKDNWKYIYMNFAFWKKTEFIEFGITDATKSEVLSTMKEYWNDHFPQTKLFEGNSEKN
ncbi:hypothetical protein [Paenibacillus sp. NFR01]|uniref:hypothetical protein n=1 Tax=Paenibacillus sp. NFR01 TaxID=1566279 RepID=UPI0008AE161B|nr:hypothetical protein [Paenibacillus sp. NFR01]SES87999.1 hypothetical protein SAMN03159358_0189 [Paenibacillus sp. NFR01]